MTAKSSLLRLLIVLFLLSTPGHLQTFAQQNAAPRSDREKDALIGAVAKIKTEYTQFDLEGEKWVESERMFMSENEYNGAGKEINHKYAMLHGDAISPVSKCKYRHTEDEKGRVKEVYLVCDSKEQMVEKFTYEDDKHGNWIKKSEFVFDESSKEFRPRHVYYREIKYFD